ncbi:quinon protein alcohol dehydrogenase-like superfamily [Mycena haematopus]|nr:quinon protein alcohol dehydrogenase-like superfamily [Mycena haematopus]
MSYSRLPYIRQLGVKSHSGNILALAVTEDGKTLASGGSQGTRLFDTDNMTEIKRPSGAGSRGYTVSLLWARQTDEPHDVLYSGTQNGYFFCWRQDKTSKAFEETFVTQITMPAKSPAWLSTPPTTDFVYAVAPTYQKYANFVPRSITFAAFDNSSDRDIIVFGSGHNGPIYTLRGRSGEWKSDWSVGAYIGSAVVDWREGVLCLNDPYVGPALFRHADQTKARSFEVPRELPGDPLSSDVCFGEKGSTIVTGSDHGTVYVFDIRSGDTVQKLETGRSKRIKAVATAEIGGSAVIIAAHTYSDEGFQEIMVWKRARATVIGLNEVGMLLKALVLVGFVAFMYQNFLAGYWEPKWSEADSL